MKKVGIDMSYIRVVEESKCYQMAGQEVYANKNISFTIEQGEFVVILGPSGAGKSTLLNILGGMDVVTSGSVWIDEQDIATYSEKELTMYRRKDVGFVFQNYNLIPNLTALENVELASQLVQGKQQAKEILTLVGLEQKENHFPSQLSGGEQQRVSIARALAKEPKLLLCDEPTGALDSKTGQQVLEVLHTASRQKGSTVLVITHNQEIAKVADRVIVINNGSVESVTLQEHPKRVMELDW